MSRPAQPPQASIMDEIRKIPPVTRTLVGATLVVTVPVMLELVSPYKILFVLDSVKRGQLWRLPTSFFFGGSGLPFIFDLIMLYRNSNDLECTWYPRRSSDYAYQLLIASLAILGLNLPLKSFIHYRPLLCCITYLSSRLNPDAPVSIFGLLTVRALFFPFVLVGLDLIQGGPGAAMVSLTGIIAGHLWYLLEWTRGGRGMGLRAPGFLRRLMGDGEREDTERRDYGRAFVPRDRQGDARDAARHHWGRGNRLGTE